MNKILLASITSILKPLISLMYRNGIAFGDFSQLSKQVYIDVIEKELQAENEKVTTSKLAIITGMTRKEVATIRKMGSHELQYESHFNRAVKVISHWATDPKFTDKEGNPKILPIQGDGESFETLVNLYSGDMPYRSVLNELIRTDAVKVIDDDRVELLRVAHIPSDDNMNKYSLLGEDAALLISTIRHNILASDEEPRFQRKVCYNHIPEKHVKAFKKLAGTESQKLLEKLNKWLSKHDSNEDTSNAENTKKVGVGTYYFEESNTEPREEDVE